MKSQADCIEALDVGMLARAGEVLRVLAHPARLRLLALLERQGPTPVLELAARAGLSQPAASQQLSVLRRKRLLAAERRGRQIWYSVRDPAVPAMLCCMRSQYGQAEPIRSK